MRTRDVGMLIDDIGLVSIAHALHIEVCRFDKLFVGERIQRMRIERDVEYRRREAALGRREKGPEGFGEPACVDISVGRCDR